MFFYSPMCVAVEPQLQHCRQLDQSSCVITEEEENPFLVFCWPWVSTAPSFHHPLEERCRLPISSSWCNAQLVLTSHSSCVGSRHLHHPSSPVVSLECWGQLNTSLPLPAVLALKMNNFLKKISMRPLQDSKPQPWITFWELETHSFRSSPEGLLSAGHSEACRQLFLAA